MPRLHDLTHPLRDDLPPSPGLPPARFEAVWRIPEQMANVSYYSFSSHFGTHMDAPRHYYADGRSLDRYAPARFKGRGFVVPLAGRRDGAIGPDELVPYREQIARAPFVLLSTGWARHFGTAEYLRHPYLDEAAARLLVELGVRCVILDVMTPDKPLALDPDRDDGPVHRVFLGNDVLIVENAAPMGEVEQREVEVMAFPLAIEGADGAPVRLMVES